MFILTNTNENQLQMVISRINLMTFRRAASLFNLFLSTVSPQVQAIINIWIDKSIQIYDWKEI